MRLADCMETLPGTLTLPPRTILRAGAVAELLSECATFGRRGFLVHGRSLEQGGALERILGARPPGIDIDTWTHPGGEPTLEQLESLLRAARSREVEWIAGVGGGSVLDVAKAAAGLLHAPLPARAYHDGAEIEPSRVPFIAVPTTAGTGSEATIAAVLINQEQGLKKSMRHPSLMAALVLLDPDLLATCPPRVVACSGMDAFVQAVESYLSNKATWFTETLSLRAVALIAGSLEEVHGGGRDRSSDLLVGSYSAGVAFSNARLGLAHGLAHPLGIRYHVPHGLVCAVCLPPVLAFNRNVIGKKYDRLSSAIGSDLADRLAHWLSTFGLESPFAGKPIADRTGIVAETMASGSTAANPRAVTEENVTELLELVFGPPTRLGST